jgi:hypothetical protein
MDTIVFARQDSCLAPVIGLELPSVKIGFDPANNSFFYDQADNLEELSKNPEQDSAQLYFFLQRLSQGLAGPENEIRRAIYTQHDLFNIWFSKEHSLKEKLELISGSPQISSLAADRFELNAKLIKVYFADKYFIEDVRLVSEKESYHAADNPDDGMKLIPLQDTANKQKAIETFCGIDEILMRNPQLFRALKFATGKIDVSFAVAQRIEDNGGGDAVGVTHFDQTDSNKRLVVLALEENSHKVDFDSTDFDFNKIPKTANMMTVKGRDFNCLERIFAHEVAHLMLDKFDQFLLTVDQQKLAKLNELAEKYFEFSLAGPTDKPQSHLLEFAELGWIQAALNQFEKYGYISAKEYEKVLEDFISPRSSESKLEFFAEYVSLYWLDAQFLQQSDRAMSEFAGLITSWVNRETGENYLSKDTLRFQTDILQKIINKQQLEKAIKQERSASGFIMPEITVMSDFHGEIDLFMQYICDVIYQKTGKKIKLDPKQFPDVSIKAQLRAQGFNINDLKKEKISFRFLGDFSDRGKYGMKCFEVAQELKGLGLAEVVIGNHDLLEMMASMGYHLPIHKGYNLYGHQESEKLVFQTHWNDPEIAKDRFGWWSKKLNEFVKQKKTMQQENFKINGQEDVKDVREHFKAIYLTIEDQLAEDEKELWQDLVGFFFGTTDVATGFNDIGMMSVDWWKDKAEKVDRFLTQARKRAKTIKAQSGQSAHEVQIWEGLKEYVDEAHKMVKKQLDQDKAEGKWWHQVFNDINHQAYTSAEWYAMDWIFHKGWGTSVLAELNDLEADPVLEWDASNFMHNKHIQDFAGFTRKNFKLYLKDDYGFYYTHGWLPVNMQTGDIEFVYKGVLYRNKDIWQGLEKIEQDVQNPQHSFSDIAEALKLVMSWYADKTVKIKPQHIKAYIEKFGIKAIQQKLGARAWFTCHNPLNTLSPKGVKFIEQEGDYAHISVDKGMSWKKFKDVGGYVLVDGRTIKLRGFSDATFEQIIDNPMTMIVKIDEDQNTTSVKLEDNRPLEKEKFTDLAIKQIQDDIDRLQKQRMQNLNKLIPHLRDLDFGPGQFLEPVDQSI